MFKTKLTLVLCSLLFLVLFVGGVFYWGMQRTLHFQESARVDHVELEAYLAVSGEIYRLFRQYRMVLGSDRPEELSDLHDSQMRLQDCLRELQHLTADEIAFAGSPGLDDGERQELALLANLTGEIQQVLAELQRIEELFADGAREEAVVRLTAVLEERIESTISGMLKRAIKRERWEVAEADRAAKTVTLRMRQIIQFGGGFAILFVVAAIVLLRRNLSRPIELLNAGVAKLASGDFSHRIALAGRSEFGRMASSFNEMAVDLAHQRDELQEARRTLERKVTVRTEDLQRANEALGIADKVRRRFFADISHELRTPITVIRGEGEVSLRGQDKTAEEYQASFRRIVEQAEQLARLVDDLLLIARSNAGTAQLRKNPVNLGALIRGTCEDTRALAENAGIVVEFGELDRAIQVQGDDGRLRQLLLILLDNALRYCEQGDRITLSLHREIDRVLLQLADSGPGIPADELGHVFDRFFRGRDGRRLSPEGSGLGLPLAKAIAEAHGGRILIESEVGAGTKVQVRLPLNGSEQSELEHHAA